MASVEHQDDLSKIQIKSNDLSKVQEIEKNENVKPQNNKEDDHQKEHQDKKEECLQQTLPEKSANFNSIASIAGKLPAPPLEKEKYNKDEQKCIVDNVEENVEKSKDLENDAITAQNKKEKFNTEKSTTKNIIDRSIKNIKAIDFTIKPLSDGEEEEQLTSASIDLISGQPDKVKKRRSVGSVGQQTTDEHYRLKRRKINVEGAPKMPLTGYVRYMNDRREILRKEQPNKTFMEHTKIIGEEWQTMSIESKSPYMQEAELDKQRYVKELHTFLRSRPDILASELAKNKSRKSLDSNININDNSIVKESSSDMKSHISGVDITKEKPTNKSSISFNTMSNQKTFPEALNETPVPPTTQTQLQVSTTNVGVTISNVGNGNNVPSTSTSSEIPIFTNEFLEHNKLYDMELKTLRKSKIDLEQQNAVLEKYVENMNNGLHKMVTENNELQEKNRLLEVYLNKLKSKLAQALNGLPLPNMPSGATIDNIEQYMNELYTMSNTNTHGPASLNKAKDIIRKLDLHIQL